VGCVWGYKTPFDTLAGQRLGYLSVMLLRQDFTYRLPLSLLHKFATVVADEVVTLASTGDKTAKCSEKCPRAEI